MGWCSVFQTLVSHNDDLNRLVEKGYAVAFDSGHMIVRNIPYLDQDLNLQKGAIVTKLTFIDETHVQQVNHQIFFAGSSPYGLDGAPVKNMGDSPAQVVLSDACKDVVVQRSFSNLPNATKRWADFFDKIDGYVVQISGPAMAKYDVDPYTFGSVTEGGTDPIFKFQDTLTSRAEITDLRTKFTDEVVAIIGLGGTGSYVLDFMVKTPVREIRAFDLDPFHVHNAFRSPGRLEKSELGKAKADVYADRYENFRTGLKLVPKIIDASCAADLEGVTFAFVCVDKGSSRSAIFDLLLSMGIPFIDVGMGLSRQQGALNGMTRITYFDPAHGADIKNKGLAPLSDPADDLYKVNIQISELNALNASMAVIRYKQLRGFYTEEEAKYHLVFNVGDYRVLGLAASDEI